MNDNQKTEIRDLVELEKSRLGSYAKVAKKCEVSAGTISAIVNSEWKFIATEMWSKVGKALGWKSGKWVLTKKITNYKAVERHAKLSKKMSMFTAISDPGGSGKTVPLSMYTKEHADDGVFYICCWEWTGRVFLLKLCGSLGIDIGKGYKRVDDLLDMVIAFFHERSDYSPQLIIDQYDKLKPAAKRLLIPLFNGLEDILSVIVAGTETLQSDIEKGVKSKVNGYDEIDSRLGRSYMKLFGVTKSDCEEICFVNGLEDKETIQKLWTELPKERQDIKDKSGRVTDSIIVTKDLRRLKRVVQRELFRISG